VFKKIVNKTDIRHGSKVQMLENFDILKPLEAETVSLYLNSAE